MMSQACPERLFIVTYVKSYLQIIAANKEAKKTSAVLDSDGDTFLKNECKADKWLIIELSQGHEDGHACTFPGNSLGNFRFEQLLQMKHF